MESGGRLKRGDKEAAKSKNHGGRESKGTQDRSKASKGKHVRFGEEELEEMRTENADEPEVIG